MEDDGYSTRAVYFTQAHPGRHTIKASVLHTASTVCPWKNPHKTVARIYYNLVSLCAVHCVATNQFNVYVK